MSAALVLALDEPTVASVVERQAGLEIEVGRERGLTADEVATTLARHPVGEPSSFSTSRRAPTLRPAALRRDLDRLLGRLGLGDDPGAPREIAVVLALRDGIPLRDALERLGIDTAPLDLPPPPEAVPFSRIAPGRSFSWKDHVWIRAALHQALAATPDRSNHPRVVAAYLAATRRGQAATAFRWASGATCLAERIEADVLVTPAALPVLPAVLSPSPAWVSMADQSPDLGRAVTIDTRAGPILARLLLDDESSGGASWQTVHGDQLDVDEVSRWRL